MCRHETLGRGMRIRLTTSITTESHRSSHKETELESRIVRIDSEKVLHRREQLTKREKKQDKMRRQALGITEQFSVG